MDAQHTHGRLPSGSALARSIEADIRAELESHLELCEEDLRSRGSSPEQAREQALARFGDFEKTQRACRRQKLRGPIMLQRWTLVATGLLLVAVFVLGYRSHTQARVMAQLTDELRAREAYLLQDRDLRGQGEALALEPVIARRGDSIELRSAYNADDLDLVEPLASDGTVLLPHLGHVPVAGLERGEVEELLRERYASYYSDVDLHVKVHKGVGEGL